jgi:Kef-type K+ transport system membrane component KefB
MSIDFGTLATHPLRIIILLVGFLVIKMGMLWLIARPLKVPNKQRRWFAVLLGQEVNSPLWSLAPRKWQMCSTRSGRKP